MSLGWMLENTEPEVRITGVFGTNKTEIDLQFSQTKVYDSVNNNTVSSWLDILRTNRLASLAHFICLTELCTRSACAGKPTSHFFRMSHTAKPDSVIHITSLAEYTKDTYNSTPLTRENYEQILEAIRWPSRYSRRGLHVCGKSYQIEYGDGQFAIVAVESPVQLTTQSASFTACYFGRGEQDGAQPVLLVSFCKPLANRTEHTMAVLELADQIRASLQC
ncbi:hypothetical protein FBUS_01283 [Fasciolopsis buskii]|uniref:Uncharacterized protein n=1 Tax=Fasciolopsis buskii TaxID=27845 RepID=A0A8E0RQI5_9TREM|nr:hypothetical protein FBUS_01283 [Fasciolopsis buski]